MTEAKETWASLVHDVFVSYSTGPMQLKDIYAVTPQPVGHGNKDWKAKIRQCLEHGPYVRVGKGVWNLRSRYTDEEVQMLERLRRERYPRRR